MYKKNSAVDLTDMAIGILILGIVVAIGSRVLILYRDNRLTDLGTNSTSNESVVINATGDTLSNVWVESITTCYCNTTGVGATSCTTANQTIASGNYTLSVNSLNGIGTLTNATTVTYNDSACTYTTYDIGSPQWQLANDAAIGISEYGNWFDIIVIVGIAGLILALIFMAFSNRGSQGGVTY